MLTIKDFEDIRPNVLAIGTSNPATPIESAICNGTLIVATSLTIESTASKVPLDSKAKRVPIKFTPWLFGIDFDPYKMSDHPWSFSNQEYLQLI